MLGGRGTSWSLLWGGDGAVAGWMMQLRSKLPLRKVSRSSRLRELGRLGTNSGRGVLSLIFQGIKEHITTCSLYLDRMEQIQYTLFVCLQLTLILRGV